METELIIVREYIRHSNIEPQFIALLEENELIHIQEIDNERFINCNELAELERYAHLYYDLSINVEGIDTIRHLLEKINLLQNEMKSLRNQLRFFE